MGKPITFIDTRQITALKGDGGTVLKGDGGTVFGVEETALNHEGGPGGGIGGNKEKYSCV